MHYPGSVSGRISSSVVCLICKNPGLERKADFRVAGSDTSFSKKTATSGKHQEYRTGSAGCTTVQSAQLSEEVQPVFVYIDSKQPYQLTPLDPLLFQG